MKMKYCCICKKWNQLMMQCVTASKKLSYKKLQADLKKTVPKYKKLMSQSIPIGYIPPSPATPGDSLKKNCPGGSGFVF